MERLWGRCSLSAHSVFSWACSKQEEGNSSLFSTVFYEVSEECSADPSLQDLKEILQ